MQKKKKTLREAKLQREVDQGKLTMEGRQNVKIKKFEKFVF